MASSHVRPEEYASSGLVVQSEDVGDTLSRIQLRPARVRKVVGKHNLERARVAHTASASHCQNDRYMEAFDTERAVAAGARTGSQRHDNRSAAVKPLRCSSAANATQKLAKQTSSDAVGVEVSHSWTRGPRVPEGEVHAVSAQPLLCMSMSVDECEVVVGSSDHALYVLPVGPASRGRRPRTLYSKKYGHSEWVTCVTHLSDRRIVSGGMDSKLCLWDATGVKCDDLLGHSGSVSSVQSLSDQLVVSTGYDKMVRLWNVGRRRPRECHGIKGGTAPILDLSLLFRGHEGVCGDRDGGVQVIDFQATTVCWKHARAHQGHTTSVLGSQSEEAARCFYSGGQDGIINGWDTRQETAVVSVELHRDPRQHQIGAVSFLREPLEDANVLLTAGADGVINVLDKRQSFRVRCSFTEHVAFIYSLHLRGPLCFSGAGNGMLHVHNWKNGELLYGLGANQAAIRAIGTSRDHLVAAGDDGGVVMYDMGDVY